MKTISLDMMISMAGQIKNFTPKKFYIANFCAIPEEIEDSKKISKTFVKKQYYNLIILQESGVNIHPKF